MMIVISCLLRDFRGLCLIGVCDNASKGKCLQIVGWIFFMSKCFGLNMLANCRLSCFICNLREQELCVGYIGRNWLTHIFQRDPCSRIWALSSLNSTKAWGTRGETDTVKFFNTALLVCQIQLATVKNFKTRSEFLTLP